MTGKDCVHYSGKYKIVTQLFRSSKLLGKENVYLRKWKQYKTLSEILALSFISFPHSICYVMTRVRFLKWKFHRINLPKTVCGFSLFIGESWSALALCTKCPWPCSWLPFWTHLQSPPLLPVCRMGASGEPWLYLTHLWPPSVIVEASGALYF